MMKKGNTTMKSTLLQHIAISLAALTMVALPASASTATITPTTVAVPEAGVSVTQSNLSLQYTGNSSALVSFGDAKASYSTGVSTNTATSGNTAGKVFTPESLRTSARSAGGMGSSMSALSAQVSGLNRSGIAVMGGVNSISVASVIPNPDVDDTQIDGGDQENGAPIGDALLPLLLMMCVYMGMKKIEQNRGHKVLVRKM